MKQGIVFLREKVIHSKNPDVTPHKVILVRVPAVYVGESEPLCEICHESEEGHLRPRRRHAYTPMTEPGITIDVQYPDEPVEPRHNVQHGDTANCWTESN